jgi:hypothetical protein
MSVEPQDGAQYRLSDLVGYLDAGDRYAAAREAGEIGEALSSVYVNELADGNVVSQHDPGDAPQGIDTTFLDPDGDLHAAETKTIGFGDWHQPQTSRTADGRQMDQAWTADRLSGIDVDAAPEDIGEDPGQVHRDLFQADIPGDTFAVYSVADDGTRAENSPSEVWSLSDIAALVDADAPDADVSDADVSDVEAADQAEAG